ncbi:MAG: glutamate formimidoyltransferase [bacterium]
MTKLIECVPNFSEGRDLSLVDDIVGAIKACKVLNVHSDPDHNRSVVTFIGEPDSVSQAAFELTERAMQLLDIREHKGEHPRIGVVDVVPFVPVKNISVQETVELAHAFAHAAATKLALPVYLYGEAAKRKEHKELPTVRQQKFEPDFGKGKHPTAGTIAVGVRDFLIAFNINLATRDLDLARSIARNIRENQGGLPGVRALGIDLVSRGITQVSINLCDHRTTSLKTVFDSVKRWADEYQVEIIESELVGMLPKEAYSPGLEKELNIRNFSERQILSL